MNNIFPKRSNLLYLCVLHVCERNGCLQPASYFTHMRKCAGCREYSRNFVIYRKKWYSCSKILDSLMAWLAGVQLNSVFLFSPSQAMSESRIFEQEYHFLRYYISPFLQKMCFFLLLKVYDFHIGIKVDAVQLKLSSQS